MMIHSCKTKNGVAWDVAWCGMGGGGVRRGSGDNAGGGQGVGRECRLLDPMLPGRRKNSGEAAPGHPPKHD